MEFLRVEPGGVVAAVSVEDGEYPLVLARSEEGRWVHVVHYQILVLIRRTDAAPRDSPDSYLTLSVPPSPPLATPGDSPNDLCDFESTFPTTDAPLVMYSGSQVDPTKTHIWWDTESRGPPHLPMGSPIHIPYALVHPRLQGALCLKDPVPPIVHAICP